jgi:O-antigen/teichoic acid export membrane protein
LKGEREVRFDSIAVLVITVRSASSRGAVVVRWLRRFLPKGELTRGVLVLVLGTVVAQGILVVSSPILTRLYAPSDLGVLSVVTSILSVLLTIACLSYENAIPLPEDDVEGANVVVLCLIVNLIVSLLAAIILWLAGPAIVSILGAAVLGPIIVITALDQFAGGVAVAFNGWAIRTRTFPMLAATNVLQSGTQAASQIGFGVLGAGAVGLIVGDVISRTAAAAALARAAWRADGPIFRAVTRSGIVSGAKRYRRFPLLSSGSALLNTLGLQAPTLLLIALYGTQVGGFLYLAQRVAALPITLLARSVGQVYFSEAARLTREDPPQLRSLFLRTTISLGRTGIGPTVLLMIASPLLFAPVFGEAWRDAGFFAAFLAPMYLLTLVTSPTGATLDVLERQDLHLARELLRLVLVGGAVLTAAAAHLSPLAAVAVLSGAGCATYCMYGLISWYAIVSQAGRLGRQAPPPA